MVLCRWAEGFHEVRLQESIDAIGRREALLGLGAIDNIGEVERVAGMQLSVVAYPRTAIAADLAPIDRSDRPYWAFNVADTITAPDYGTGTIGQRVRAITGAEDDDGEVTYSPELGDLILEEQERTLQAVKKMADGTLEGESPVAQPPLRPQILRVWTAPAQPPSGGGGFTTETYATYDAYQTSNVLRSVPPGDGTYTLTRMWSVADSDGPFEGLPTTIDLWQWLGPDAEYAAASVQMGVSYSAGVEYDATIAESSIRFGQGEGIRFSIIGTRTSGVRTFAEFEGGGEYVFVAWPGPTLRVSHHPI